MQDIIRCEQCALYITNKRRLTFCDPSELEVAWNRLLMVQFSLQEWHGTLDTWRSSQDEMCSFRFNQPFLLALRAKIFLRESQGSEACA